MQPGRRHRTASENEQEVSNAENENASDNVVLDVDMQNGGENEHVNESGNDENESDMNESESDMNDNNDTDNDDNHNNYYKL